jgi:hypothetical protein
MTMSETEINLMFMAVHLLDGKNYRVSSDNPETIRRATAIAQQIGATVEHSDGGFLRDVLPPGLTSIRLLVPPSGLS